MQLLEKWFIENRIIKKIPFCLFSSENLDTDLLLTFQVKNSFSSLHKCFSHSLFACPMFLKKYLQCTLLSIQLKRIIIGNSTFRVNFNAAAECCVKKFWNSPNGANRNSPNSRESFSKRVCWKIAVAVISETFRKSLRTYYLNW